MARSLDDIDALTPEDALRSAIPDSSVADEDRPKLHALRGAAVQKQNADQLARESLPGYVGYRRFRLSEEERVLEEEERERTVKKAREAYEREVRERSARLLEQISEAEVRILRQREEIDRRALKLHDGRRAYVDGQDYRDGEGVRLTGEDEAEARRLHAANPQAATWQEKAEIEQQWRDAQALRYRVEHMEKGREGETLAATEVEFHEKIDSRAAVLRQDGPHSASADYMAELGGLSGEFAQVSENKVSHETTAASVKTPYSMTQADIDALAGEKFLRRP